MSRTQVLYGLAGFIALRMCAEALQTAWGLNGKSATQKAAVRSVTTPKALLELEGPHLPKCVSKGILHALEIFGVRGRPSQAAHFLDPETGVFTEALVPV